MRMHFVLQEIWIGLRRNLTMTVSLVVTVAIAMALFGTGMLIRKQVDGSKSYWYDKVEVSIFFCVAKSSSNPDCHKRDATQAEKDALKEKLGRLPNVKNVEYENQQQAFTRFQGNFAKTPGFVNATKVGDIPDSYRVALKDPQKYGEVMSAAEGTAGVDQVVNERVLLDELFKILNGLQWAALFLAMIQVF